MGLEIFCGYQSKEVTPYIHALINHIKLMKHTSFTQQRLKKLNDIVTKNLFRSSHHQDAAFNQLIEKKIKRKSSLLKLYRHNRLTFPEPCLTAFTGSPLHTDEIKRKQIVLHNVYDDVIYWWGATTKFKFRQYFLSPVWVQIVKLKNRQYFQLYGISDNLLFKGDVYQKNTVYVVLVELLQLSAKQCKWSHQQQYSVLHICV